MDTETGAFQEADGVGIIPNSAFRVNGQTASLNVDTSTTIGNGGCVLDPNNLGTCNPNPGGLVIANWTVPAGLGSSHTVGVQQNISPNKFNETHAGTSDYKIARVDATILGDTVNIAGILGMNHNTTISVIH